MLNKDSIAIAIGLLFRESHCFANENACPSRASTTDAANCIERERINPAELGSTIGIGDCAWAYAEVENRKIGVLERGNPLVI